MPFGWITPSKVFIETPRFSHFRAIIDNSILSNLLPENLRNTDDLDAIAQACQSLAEAGEHPEWHCYEMACDSREADVVNAMYDAGAIRVGTAISGICFEGRPKAITNLAQFCKDFAEERENTAIFEPRRGK